MATDPTSSQVPPDSPPPLILHADAVAGRHKEAQSSAAAQGDDDDSAPTVWPSETIYSGRNSGSGDDSAEASSVGGGRFVAPGGSMFVNSNGCPWGCTCCCLLAAMLLGAVALFFGGLLQLLWRLLTGQ